MLITFYWFVERLYSLISCREATLRKLEVIPVLRKMKWPAIIFGVLLIGLVGIPIGEGWTVQHIVYSFIVPIPGLFVVLILLLAVGNAGFALFYWIVGGKLLFVLGRIEAPNLKQQNYRWVGCSAIALILSQMTIWMVLTGFRMCKMFCSIDSC